MFAPTVLWRSSIRCAARQHHKVQLKRMSKIAKWTLLLFLAGIGKAHWVGAAEPIRSVFLQVPSIDTGTTLMLLYGKRWDYSNKRGWTYGSSSQDPTLLRRL
jgi:hypothetical protein